METQEQPITPEQERPPKGVAFVFSRGVDSSNPNELDKPSKERLDTAWGLYKQGKIDVFLLTGGEFIEGLEKPVSSLMKEYLVAKKVEELLALDISQDEKKRLQSIQEVMQKIWIYQRSEQLNKYVKIPSAQRRALEQELVTLEESVPALRTFKNQCLEEPEARDTHENVDFGRGILKKHNFDRTPLYFVSSDEHTRRIVQDLRERGEWDAQLMSVAKTGTNTADSLLYLTADLVQRISDLHDPHGLVLPRLMRRWVRTKPIDPTITPDQVHAKLENKRKGLSTGNKKR